jgi:hypothetical protein
MPRDTTDIATRQNLTPQDNSAAGVPLQVAAQAISEHNTIQGTKATQMADQLSESLGIANKVGGQVFAKQQANDTQQGANDAAMGVTKDNPSTAYRAAQDHVHALASWAVDGDNIAMQAQKQGFDQNPDAKQGLADLNNWLNGQFAQLYTGSSKSTEATLQPKMIELRNNLNSWFTQQIAGQVNAKNQADIKTIAGSAFAKSFTPIIEPTTGQPSQGGGGAFDPAQFDYQGINDNIHALYPGPQGNTLMLSNLADMAISHGTPSLLTSMPDRWADGTPTPKGSGDPKMVDEFRRAVKQAQAQQERNLTDADGANKDAQKTQADNAAKDMLTQIASGKKYTLEEFNLNYGNLPGANHHDWQAMWEQNQSYGTKQDRLNLESLQTTEGLQEYGSKFNSIKSQVILGTAGYQTLPQVLDQIHTSGYTGVTADKMLAKLAPQVEAAGNNILKNPEDAGRLAQIKSVYNPGNYDSISKKFDNEQNNAAREAALQAYHFSRASGATPDDAMKAADTAAANASKIYQDTQGKQGESTRSAAQAYKDTAVTLIPTKAIRKALQQNDTATLRGFGLNARELNRRLVSKEITPEEFTALRSKLK